VSETRLAEAGRHVGVSMPGLGHAQWSLPHAWWNEPLELRREIGTPEALEVFPAQTKVVATLEKLCENTSVANWHSTAFESARAPGLSGRVWVFLR